MSVLTVPKLWLKLWHDHFRPPLPNKSSTAQSVEYVDGFYEHHHHKGQTYPYYIYRKDGEPMIFAGLYNDWADPDTGEVMTTFTIVTTEGNPMLARIHNNPKLSGPRMPLILPDPLADRWLDPLKDELDQKALQELIRSYPEEPLAAHTVSRLRGRTYAGNIPQISSEVSYPELE